MPEEEPLQESQKKPKSCCEDLDEKVSKNKKTQRHWFKNIGLELKSHAPFTLFGATTGCLLLFAIMQGKLPRRYSTMVFWYLHPLHVFLSALVTTGVYVRYRPRSFWSVLLVGYFGSVGIGSLSDCLIPYLGEWLLSLPHRGLHLGFIEKWWLVNPLALVGVCVGAYWPHTKVPHAGHVLLSTWASLFHFAMAVGQPLTLLRYGAVFLFLFLSVWVPCCTSDIVFPLIVASGQKDHHHVGCCH